MKTLCHAVSNIQLKTNQERDGEWLHNGDQISSAPQRQIAVADE